MFQRKDEQKREKGGHAIYSAVFYKSSVATHFGGRLLSSSIGAIETTCLVDKASLVAI